MSEFFCHNIVDACFISTHTEFTYGFCGLRTEGSHVMRPYTLEMYLSLFSLTVSCVLSFIVLSIKRHRILLLVVSMSYVLARRLSCIASVDFAK